MRKPALTLLFILAYCVNGYTQAPTQPQERPLSKTERIDAAVKNWMALRKAPAISLAIVIQNQIVFQRGWGFADVKAKAPATSDTTYRLASITKSITAVAVMQLVENGKIDLDRSITEYCSAYPEKHYVQGVQTTRFSVTVRQLLHHLGGIRHSTDDEAVNIKHFKAIGSVISTFKNDALVVIPGAQFSYSTPGYVLLGCAIEGASGQPYFDYINANILKPAGMDRTFVDDINAKFPNRAIGYRNIEGGEITEAVGHDTSIKTPAGGLLSTVIDLAKFTVALNSDRLVRSDTLAEMWKKPRQADGRESTYAMGVTITGSGETLKVINDGVQIGTRTYWYTMPKQKFAVILMTNLEGARCEELVPTIVEILAGN